jgi:general secretion pathway protein A
LTRRSILDFDVLEQIRLLTNLETNDEKLLQIILIGQPELSEQTVATRVAAT